MTTESLNKNGPLPSMPDLFKIMSENSLDGPPVVFLKPLDPVEVVKKPLKPVFKVPKYCWKRSLPEITEKDRRESLFVTNYFNKVKTKLSTVYDPGGGNKFQHFVKVLKSFDPYKESPTDLYKNIEKIFGKEYSNLSEEFIIFLTLGQSAEIGRFMDHLYTERIIEFIQLLNTTFQRRPTPLRKIMRCISSCYSSADLEKTRQKVLPLLKSNQRLTAMFLDLLPNTKTTYTPQDDSNETELNDRLIAEGGDFDVWVFEDNTNGRRRKLEHKKIDTAYIQGRICLQRGRILRAAQANYPDRDGPNRSTEIKQDSNARTIIDNKKTTKSRPRVKAITKNSKKTNDTKKPAPKTRSMNEQSPRVSKRSKSELESGMNDEQVTKGGKKVRFEDGIAGDAPKILPSGELKSSKRIKFELPSKTEIDDNAKETKKSSKNAKKAKVIRERKHSIDKELNIKPSKKVKLEESKVATDKGNGVKVYFPDDTKLKVVTEDNNSLKMKILRISSIEDKVVVKKDSISESDKDCKSIQCDVNVIKTDLKVAETNEKDRLSDLMRIEWTREEDKTILEVLKGANVSDSTFFKIKNELPHRSINEIKDRFIHVMDLLQQMALGRG